MGGIRAEQADVDLGNLLLVAVVAPLDIRVVLRIAGNAADVEQQVLFLPVPLYPRSEEGVLHILVEPSQKFRDPLGAELGSVETPLVKPGLCIAEGFPGTHRVFCKFKDVRGILRPQRLGENVSQPDTGNDGIKDEALAKERRLGNNRDRMFLDPGCFLTGKVILVVDDLAIRALLADTFAAVTPLFLLAVPVSGILIDIGDTCVLVVDLDDLGCAPCFFHSYFCSYVLCKSQPQDKVYMLIF